MKRFIGLLLAPLCLLLITALSWAGLEELDQSTLSFEQLVQAMNHPDWRPRTRSVYDIIAFIMTSEDEEKLLLAGDLLLDEIRKQFQDEEGNKKEWQMSEYLGDLCWEAACVMKSDPRILDLLLEASRFCGGTKMDEAMIGFGDQTLLKMIDMKKDSKSTIPGATFLRIINQMLLADRISLIRKPMVRNFALDLLKDEEFYTRVHAVEVLETLIYSSTTPILETVAENDPFINTRGEYVVRERAKKALEKMKTQVKP